MSAANDKARIAKLEIQIALLKCEIVDLNLKVEFQQILLEKAALEIDYTNLKVNREGGDGN
jgi:uncharacterized coiled-coil protein SlyX